VDLARGQRMEGLRGDISPRLPEGAGFGVGRQAHFYRGSAVSYLLIAPSGRSPLIGMPVAFCLTLNAGSVTPARADYSGCSPIPTPCDREGKPMRRAGVRFALLSILACWLGWSVSLTAEEKGKGKEKGVKEVAGQFVYPNAKMFGDDREGGGIYHAKYTTPDAMEKAANWYRKKINFATGEGISFNRHQEPGLKESVLADSRQPGKKGLAVGEPRPVSLLSLMWRKKGITGSAVVSRVKGRS
jgi:hypothetical protein